MSQAPLQEQSDSEIDYDHEINHEEDEEDWQDAEEEHPVQASLVAVPITTTAAPTKEPEQNHIINETELRKKIKEIQLDKTFTAKDKARQIQYLMSHGTTHPLSVASKDQPDATESIYCKSYHNQEQEILGCKHYQRNCKLQANCCEKIYTCRFCHDEAEDHTIVRHETKIMLCMMCLTLQPAAQNCNSCGERVASYYCDKCKLWDDDPKKSIYHCDDCGICRQGNGLGKDFFHCEKCNICLNISMKNHKCIERNLESDCPICGEYMFTSTLTVIFMPCGHCIHKHCYTAYIQTSYQCPTCLKSLGDMSEYFNRLDKDLERQPMPAEYEKFISHIFCNDCEKKTPAKYHFFYHKCGHCGSFNTTVLKTENTEETAQKAASSTVAAALEAPGSSANAASATMEVSNETAGSSSNSDQDHTMQSQLGNAPGNSTTPGSFLGIAGYIRNPPPSASSSSSRARNGTESNEG
ncbi:zinc-ribbon-domain-containing protein [Parasitella parasitica]|nr:zinc-ribbon-domain-containing protein [Parasitella parasitica]